MCVILDIPANRSIPKEMLAQACDINPDGHGIAWIDKGAIRVRRSITKNDPEEIEDAIGKLRRYRRIVHLRYSTAGAISMDNNHPLVVLENKKGAQLVMFHNGTLSDYRKPNSVLSDTFFFNDEFVQPLARRVEAYGTLKKVVADPIFRRLMSKEIGSMSVVVLLDSFGNAVRFNEHRGKQYETFWASNDYSFDKNHHRSSSFASHWQNTSSLIHRPTSVPSFGLPWEEVPSNDRQLQISAWEKETTKPPTIIAASPSVAEEVTKLRVQFVKFHAHVLALRAERVK